MRRLHCVEKPLLSLTKTVRAGFFWCCCVRAAVASRSSRQLWKACDTLPLSPSTHTHKQTGSGTIDVKELKTALESMGHSPSDEELFAIVHEVCAWVLSCRIAEHEQDCQSVQLLCSCQHHLNKCLSPPVCLCTCRWTQTTVEKSSLWCVWDSWVMWPSQSST